MKKRSHRKENLQLLSLAAPAILLLLVFNYWPMFGIILAFKDYKVPKGIWGSPWAGFKNFEFFLKSQDATRVIRNTLGLNLMFITAGIFFGVLFALIMFEVKKKRQVKVYQTVSIIPSFISWVAVGYIVYAFLDPTKGLLNQILTACGKSTIAWYSEPRRGRELVWEALSITQRSWGSTANSSRRQRSTEPENSRRPGTYPFRR